MVDYFAIAVSHALLALTAWRIMLRAELDRDPPSSEDAGAADGAGASPHA